MKNCYISYQHFDDGGHFVWTTCHTVSIKDDVACIVLKNVDELNKMSKDGTYLRGDSLGNVEIVFLNEEATKKFIAIGDDKIKTSLVNMCVRNTGASLDISTKILYDFIKIKIIAAEQTKDFFNDNEKMLQYLDGKIDAYKEIIKLILEKKA